MFFSSSTISTVAGIAAEKCPPKRATFSIQQIAKLQNQPLVGTSEIC
jgi:hypothetical protein